MKKIVAGITVQGINRVLFENQKSGQSITAQSSIRHDHSTVRTLWTNRLMRRLHLHSFLNHMNSMNNGPEFSIFLTQSTLMTAAVDPVVMTRFLNQPVLNAEGLPTVGSNNTQNTRDT